MKNKREIRLIMKSTAVTNGKFGENKMLIQVLSSIAFKSYFSISLMYKIQHNYILATG